MLVDILDWFLRQVSHLAMVLLEDFLLLDWLNNGMVVVLMSLPIHVYLSFIMASPTRHVPESLAMMLTRRPFLPWRPCLEVKSETTAFALCKIAGWNTGAALVYSICY
jgi:hypothetical protein